MFVRLSPPLYRANLPRHYRFTAPICIQFQLSGLIAPCGAQ